MGSVDAVLLLRQHLSKEQQKAYSALHEVLVQLSFIVLTDLSSVFRHCNMHGRTLTLALKTAVLRRGIHTKHVMGSTLCYLMSNALKTCLI